MGLLIIFPPSYYYGGAVGTGDTMWKKLHMLGKMLRTWHKNPLECLMMLGWTLVTSSKLLHFFIFTHIEHHKILRTMGGVLSSEQSKKIISAHFFFLEWYVMNQKSFAVWAREKLEPGVRCPDHICFYYALSIHNIHILGFYWSMLCVYLSDESRKEDLVKRRLWEKSNLESYLAEMRKESKRRR